MHLYNLYFLPFQHRKNGISTRTNRTIRTSVAATGKALTVTVAVAVNGREQVPLLTLVRFKVVSAVTAVTVTPVPPAPIVAVQMLHLYNLQYFPFQL
jgi:hypothetical protein